MSTTLPNKHTKDSNVYISYIYYQVVGKDEQKENMVYSIHSDKVMEHLKRNGYLLLREDIIHLLKEDGAQFFEDSLRLYDSQENAYFQVSKDWELPVYLDELPMSLGFWIKSTNPKFNQELGKISSDVRFLDEKTKYQLEFLEEKLSAEVLKLKLSNEVLFHELAKAYKKIDPSIVEKIP